MKNTSIILGGVAAAAMVLLSSVDLTARNPFRVDQAYAYGHTVEFQGGWTGMPYSVTGDAGKASGMSSGVSFDLRYSYFFGRHFGFYTDFSTFNVDSDPARFFRTVNRADGNRYSYDTRAGRYSYGYRDFRQCDLAPVFSAGLVYRKDFGQWSLRPRIGAGVGFIWVSNDSYYRFDRNDENGAYQYFELIPSFRKYDYIRGEQNQPVSPVCFTGSASLQMTYTFRHHFFFSAEAGLNVAVKHVEYEFNSYDTRSAYHPDTWAEAVYNSDLMGAYEPDLSTVKTDTFIRNAFYAPYVRVGLGWNIGWNRNESGWYRRRR